MQKLPGLFGTSFYLACLLMAAMSSDLFAEVKCSSLLSYVVERDSQQSEIFFGETKVSSADETQAKTRLEAEIVKNKTRAMQQCTKLYENVSACLQTKLESSASTIQAASFSARKALEDALIADCKKQQGTCKEVKSSEVKCDGGAPAAGDAAAASNPEEKPKEKKGKK